MAKLLDIAGHVFGALTALEVVEREGRPRYVWRCRCDCGRQYCAKEIYVAAGILRSGNTNSCLMQQHDKSIHPAIRSAFTRCKSAAIKRKYPFVLTLDHFRELIKLPCYYCGSSTDTKRICSNSHGKSHVWHLRVNGIDRKDNTLGYTIENSVACCFTCNRAKDVMSEQDYIDHCKRVAEHSEGRIYHA